MKVASNIPSSLPLSLLFLISVRLSSHLPCSPNSLSHPLSQPPSLKLLTQIFFPCPSLSLALCSLLSRIRHKWLVLTFKALCGLSAHHWPSHIQYQKVSSCSQLVYEPRYLPLTAMLSNKPSLSSVSPHIWRRSCLLVSAKPSCSSFSDFPSELHFPFRSCSKGQCGCQANASQPNRRASWGFPLVCTSLVPVLHSKM